MERERAQAVIEAVLFAMGDSVSIADLAIAVDESEKFVKEILEEMTLPAWLTLRNLVTIVFLLAMFFTGESFLIHLNHHKYQNIL